MNYNKEELEKKIHKMREEGLPVFSFSKLGSYDECPFCYKMAYIDKNRDTLSNIYSELGTALHDGLEEIYNGGDNHLKEKFENAYLNCVTNNLTFGRQSTQDNYLANMRNFIENFQKDDLKCFNEYLFLIEIEGIYITGYIDRITKNPENPQTLRIIDYKTSTKYAKKDLIEKGRQLVLYAYAIEQLSGMKVTSICWNMLKYVTVEFTGKLKNGRKKKSSTLFERSKVVYTFRNEIIQALEDKGYSSDEAIDIYCEALETDKIPEQVRDMFIIKDGYVEHTYNEETLQELKDYIKTTVENINKESKWKPKKLDEYNIFGCSVLCNYRHICPYLKDFISKKNYIDVGIEDVDNSEFAGLVG